MMIFVTFINVTLAPRGSSTSSTLELAKSTRWSHAGSDDDEEEPRDPNAAPIERKG